MSIYNFSVKAADGSIVPLQNFRGKALLIVNVASKCGFTPQYDGLEELSKKYSAMGLTVLGFPCNQFGKQESGSDSDIQSFCKLTYGVDFAVMAKVDVNGGGADPLYKFLKSEAPGIFGIGAIKWNFTKFLVDKNGKVVKRFAPTVKPEALTRDIENILA